MTPVQKTGGRVGIRRAHARRPAGPPLRSYAITAPPS